MKKVIVTCLSVLVLTFSSSILSAEMHGKMHEMSTKNSHEKMKRMHASGYGKKGFKGKFYKKIKLIIKKSDELGISDEQLKQVKRLKSETKKSLIKQEADLESIKVDFDDEMEKENLDKNTINRLIDKKYEIKKNKAKTIIAALSDLDEILKKDQKEKLKDLCKEMMEQDTSLRRRDPQGTLMHRKRHWQQGL